MPIIKKQVKFVPTAKAKVESVLDRIKPIGSDNTFLKVMLYGESATGKTTLWATFPGPILALICSSGNKTGEVKSINTPEYREKISFVTIYNSSEIIEVVNHVKATGVYQTVVLDHVSGLQDLTLKEILGLEELPAQNSWGMATQQQYGQSTLQCKEFLRALLNLDCNVVIIGQERTFKGKEDGIDSDMIKPTIGVAVTPSLAGWLNPACDYILQTFKRPIMVSSTLKIAGKSVTTLKRGKGVEYCVRAEPHDVYYTKFRVPRGHKIPDIIIDPSFEKINAVILGEE